jgi:hypothetical protein
MTMARLGDVLMLRRPNQCVQVGASSQFRSTPNHDGG